MSVLFVMTGQTGLFGNQSGDTSDVEVSDVVNGVGGAGNLFDSFK